MVLGDGALLPCVAFHPPPLPFKLLLHYECPPNPSFTPYGTIRNIYKWGFNHYCRSSAVTERTTNKTSHSQPIIALWESPSLLLIAVCVLFYMWEGPGGGDLLPAWPLSADPDWLVPLAMCCRWSCSLAASPASCRNCVSCPSSTSATHTWSECCSPPSSQPATTMTTTRWSCSRRWAACCWLPSSR